MDFFSARSDLLTFLMTRRRQYLCPISSPCRHIEQRRGQDTSASGGSVFARDRRTVLHDRDIDKTKKKKETQASPDTVQLGSLWIRCSCQQICWLPASPHARAKDDFTALQEKSSGHQRPTRAGEGLGRQTGISRSGPAPHARGRRPLRGFYGRAVKLRASPAGGQNPRRYNDGRSTFGHPYPHPGGQSPKTGRGNIPLPRP